MIINFPKIFISKDNVIGVKCEERNKKYEFIDVLRYTIKSQIEQHNTNINELSKSTGVSKSIIEKFVSGKAKDISFYDGTKLLNYFNKTYDNNLITGYYINNSSVAHYCVNLYIDEAVEDV